MNRRKMEVAFYQRPEKYILTKKIIVTLHWNQNKLTMAFYPKPIPTLTGEVAERFIRKAEYNETYRKRSIDFTEQVAKARRILARSKYGMKRYE